jgi:hypothetical protein
MGCCNKPKPMTIRIDQFNISPLRGFCNPGLNSSTNIITALPLQCCSAAKYLQGQVMFMDLSSEGA